MGARRTLRSFPLLLLVLALRSAAANGGRCDASSFEANTDYHDGQGLGHAAAADTSACCALCASAAWAAQGCKYFTFSGADGTCWLKGDDGGRRTVANATSGSCAPVAPTPAPGQPTPPPTPLGPRSYVLDGSQTRIKFDAAGDQLACSAADVNCTSYDFDGHGGLSAGGTSRLLIDYPEPSRSRILDYLFAPDFGAAMGVLKLEIGGDAQSTDGTEPSHMHSRGDLGCRRGYEGWLAAEARKRNPAIKIWSLSWGVPGWIGNVSGHAPSYYSDDNVAYQVAWLRCLRDSWGVEPDLLGLWNERPQGSTAYVAQLRGALDAAGFERVLVTVENTWEPLVEQVAVDPAFNATVTAATKHYPCNQTSAVALHAGKKFWAGEDTQGTENHGNWSAAGCWGRKLSQSFVRMSSASSVSWAVAWAAYPGVSGNFFFNAPLLAAEPWSGHYELSPSLWTYAHWGQFANPGWRYLRVGADGGAGLLAGGGSYVTLVPPAADLAAGRYPAATFTLIVETLAGSCGAQGDCNPQEAYPWSGAQNVSFQLRGPLAGAAGLPVQLWCTGRGQLFVRQPPVAVGAGGVLALTMPPDTLCTASTLPAAQNGTKGEHPPPPASAPFPARYVDDFGASAQDALAFGFADVYGSFAVRDTGDAAVGNALTQVAAAVPTGWAPTNFDPLTYIGDASWGAVAVNVTALVNRSAGVEHGGHYVRVCAGGCGDTSSRGLSYGCDASCCLNLTWAGAWAVGSGLENATSGAISGFDEAKWHRIAVSSNSRDGRVTVAVDGAQVADVPGVCFFPHANEERGASVNFGMAGLGCGKYHQCAFAEFSLEASR
jgi:galactosylceramidase